jgi:hypothetical protein
MQILVIIYAIAIIIGIVCLIELSDYESVLLGATGIAGLLIIGAIIMSPILISLWVIFKKEGIRPWAAIVPIYNCVALCQIAGYSGRFAWLFFIPIVNVIAFLRVCKGLAKHFGRSTRFGVYLFLFFPIVLPILAFSRKIQHEYDVKTSAPAEVAFPSVREYFERKAVRECFVRAGELETAGEREKAIEQYTETISLDPRHTVAYFKRGMLLRDSGSKAAAIADFRRVIELADNPELTDLAKVNIAKLV